MREIIAALQVSVDGFIEGPNEELDWVDSWEDPFDIVGKVDAFILGARMYPGYEQYWRWTIRKAFCRSLGGLPLMEKSNTRSSRAGRRTSSCRARCRTSRGRTRESFVTSRTFAG
jgi:hypothetical protein